MFEWLANETAVLCITAFVGLCVGSFLNVVIHRLPLMMEREWRGEVDAWLTEHLQLSLQALYTKFLNKPEPEQQPLNLAFPASRCPHCGHQITSLENIPVLSYLFLRGKCSQCRAPISIRYPLVETLTGLLSVAVVWHFGATSMALGALVFLWALIALALIDLDTQLLPDSITLPLVWAGILFNLVTHQLPLETSVIGAIAGYLSLWSVHWLYYGYKSLTNRLFGREDQLHGMGYGDLKLLAAIGAFLGWKILPAVILLSSLVGACVGIGLVVFAKHGREVPIPFGPYLATAGVLALFFGPALTSLILPM
ncbi:prepilin peptidase [Uliginosibacterium gangwonense]|uniref:prepilin peptidase n=1 Tax=Uliginosibacterium gangwonense TaxID=392736 RepID=UPI000368C3C4|nr:A24 family peptidase [Uliginosibacterium gangwonense]